MQKTKRILATLFFVCGIIYGLHGRPAKAFSAGPFPSLTGAPALGSFPAEQTCRSCHATNPLNDPGTTFTINAPDTYTPGTDVTVTVTIQRGQLVKFGFQLTALDDQGNKAGELVLTDTARTQLQTANDRQYINHTATGNAATEPGKNTWSFTWRPPAQAVGRVVFYAAGNATNNNFANTGDFISTTSKAIQAAQTIAVVSAASFTAGASSESIMALFGSNLVATPIAASTTPLPTTLGGVRVVVRDLTTQLERDAPLFYVGPSQINFLLPAGVMNGMASISVLRDNSAFASGNISVTTVAPGLFTFNADGQGVPAAIALRAKAGTILPSENIAQFVNNRWEPIPINLGAADEQVFLIAFGTGFRNRMTVSATIGGTATDVLAGAQGQFVGLDQANILIPRSLIGRGPVEVVLTVDGKPANTVRITVQ